MDFEKNIKTLDEILEKLESGECSLEEATKLFEKATEISKSCNEFLEQTKGKITEITKELDKFIEKDFK